jgi:hypothetical protein
MATPAAAEIDAAAAHVTERTVTERCSNERIGIPEDDLLSRDSPRQLDDGLWHVRDDR